MFQYMGVEVNSVARHDTVVANGTLVIPEVGEVRADVGIRSGVITSISQGVRPDADEVIDATDRWVLPGAVDSHAHLGIYNDLTSDTSSETTSSTVGGVTTMISYFRTGRHYLDRSGPYREVFPEVLRRTAGHARIDYGFHLAPMIPAHLDEIPWLVDEMGVTSFKFYMFYKALNLASDSRDAAAYTMAEEYDLGFLFEVLERISEVNSTRPERISLSIHCEQAELIRVFMRRAESGAYANDLIRYSAGRPPLSERLAIEEALLLASATGAPVNLLHLSSREAVETAEAARRRYTGLDANFETTLHHLSLTNDEDLGLGAKVNPPIRTADDNASLWEALLDGTVGSVGSDHACCSLEHKRAGIWSALPGFGGTALLYPLLISEGHHRRGIPMSRIVGVAATRPARTFNLYPRKGTIAVGSDADLAIIDPDLEQVVTADLVKSDQDHSPFAGLRLKGWPVMTILRGTPVFRDGETVGDFRGEYVKRRLDRPADRADN